ncbi:MAG: methyltransferase domain-containing protein [Acidobacteria bacterium]|nr:methyltransferase domain-containing protein [Acidobacteriota bacterium]
MLQFKGDWVGELASFRRRLDEVRSNGAVSWDWYPYDSLANVFHLRDLLGENWQTQLAEWASAGPILDIGCGDGDFSLFLEHLGFQVIAIDNPVTNHNGMRGVAFLSERLGSRIAIQSTDLDERCQMPDGRFAVVCCFGLLYHLKNPFYLLERLARSADMLLMSTRIISRMPSTSQAISREPMAYLVLADELNNDNSNFWLFTEECLRRLLHRAHWKVVHAVVKRLPATSATLDQSDERIFMVLKSGYGVSGHTLLYGWHEPENEGWRWTERRFAVRFTPPDNMPGGRYKCIVELYVPEGLIEGDVPLSVEAAVKGDSIGREVYARSGGYRFVRVLPPLPAGEMAWDVEFRVGKWLEPDDSDGRERGVIVAQCLLERAE